MTAEQMETRRSEILISGLREAARMEFTKAQERLACILASGAWMTLDAASPRIREVEQHLEDAQALLEDLVLQERILQERKARAALSPV